jgi:hypothetical protein
MAQGTHSVLKPSNHVFIVRPSVADDMESRTLSGLFVAGDPSGRPPVYRGVIVGIGAHIDEPDAEIGGVVHYQTFVPIGTGDEEMHVVPQQNALCFESNS